MQSSFERKASLGCQRLRLADELAPDGTLVTGFFVAAPGAELPSHVKGSVIRN